MNKLSKYQETAKRIIEVLKSDEFILDMGTFNNNPEHGRSLCLPEHPCGTTFCLAGGLAYQDGYPEEYLKDGVFDHLSYSRELIGPQPFNKEWIFLFSKYWSNDKEAAIKRAEYVLDNNECPTVDQWGKYE